METVFSFIITLFMSIGSLFGFGGDQTELVPPAIEREAPAPENSPRAVLLDNTFVPDEEIATTTEAVLPEPEPTPSAPATVSEEVETPPVIEAPVSAPAAPADNAGFGTFPVDEVTLVNVCADEDAGSRCYVDTAEGTKSGTCQASAGGLQCQPTSEPEPS